MKISTLIPLATAIASVAQVWAAATAPVGYITLTLNGGTSLVVSQPLQRSADFVGSISSVSIINSSTGTLTVGGSPAWALDRYTYSAEGDDLFYARITSGDRAGMWYHINTVVSANTIQLDTANDPNFTDVDEASNVATTANQVRIIPYWTLSTLFPSGGDLTASANNGTGATPTGDIVSFVAVDTQLGGGLIGADANGSLNAAATKRYFVFGGNWYEWNGVSGAGSVGTAGAGDVAFTPDSYFIITSPVGAATKDITIAGTVPTSSLGTVVRADIASTGASDAEEQDNYLANLFPVDLTLSQLGLQGLSLFNSSTSVIAPSAGTDFVLVFEQGAAVAGNLPSSVFFHYAGGETDARFSALPTGWYRLGDLTPTTDAVIKAGSGFIVRIIGSGGSSVSATAALPYTLE